DPEPVTAARPAIEADQQPSVRDGGQSRQEQGEFALLKSLPAGPTPPDQQSEHDRQQRRPPIQPNAVSCQEQGERPQQPARCQSELVRGRPELATGESEEQLGGAAAASPTTPPSAAPLPA